jgi:hypothetical protein
LLGAAAYYFLVGQQTSEPVVQAPVINEMKSNNAPLTAFEESRRIVDKDPQGYLNAKAVTPRDVGDFFLLGRAQMLTGRYWEAKRSFIEARNRLATADTNDAKTLATEISMALAIIESQEATETFSKDLQTANTAAANSNTNTAANSNANTATVPVR